MFVCICNKVTDSQIREAIADGAQDFGSIQQCLGVATCCGRCSDCAQNLMQQTLMEQGACSRTKPCE